MYAIAAWTTVEASTFSCQRCIQLVHHLVQNRPQDVHFCPTQPSCYLHFLSIRVLSTYRTTGAVHQQIHWVDVGVRRTSTAIRQPPDLDT